MKKSIIFLTAVLFLTGVAAYAQSLGDLAREEQKRRDGIAAGRTISVYNAPAAESGREASDGEAADEDVPAETENSQNTSAAEAEDGDKSEDSDEEADPNETTDLYGKSESYWRKTMSDARNNLAQLEDEVKELTSRRNALQSQHSRTDGARRAAVRNELDKTRNDLDLNREKLEQARGELQSLQNDARSSGALPGWIE